MKENDGGNVQYTGKKKSVNMLSTDDSFERPWTYL